MSKSDEQFYEELADMFRSPGWENFLSEVDNQIKALTDIRTVQSESEMYHRKGQLMILDNLMNLENSIEVLREKYEEEGQR